MGNKFLAIIMAISILGGASSLLSVTTEANTSEVHPIFDRDAYIRDAIGQ